jgi:hypothetical protein
MSDLESLVRDALAAHNGMAPGGAGLLDAVRQRRTRRRRRGWASTALVTAAIVAVATLLTVSAHNGGQNSTVTAPSQSPSPGTIPPGTQPVSYHGVEIFVPAAWKINDERCGTPEANTVLVSRSNNGLCSDGGPTGLTVVRIAPATTDPGTIVSDIAALATTATTVDGQPARRGSGVLAYAHTLQHVLVLPGPNVFVSVESPNAKAAATILDSVRITPIDLNGCVDRVTTLVATLSSRPDATAALVPGRPIRATVCSYSDFRVIDSEPVPAARLSTLISTFNGLPVGLSYPGTGFGGSPAVCAEDLRNGFIVHFSYTAGSQLDVYVHIGDCTTLSASNGARTTKINAPLVNTLLDLVGYIDGFADPTALR